MDPLVPILVVVACAALWVLWTQPFGAGFQPTPGRIVREMLIMAKTKPSDIVYDLGSGEGRILVTASKEFGARSVGIEIDPLRFLVAKIRIGALGLGHVSKVVYGNFYRKDFDEATVVTLFLSGGANERLRNKLQLLRPGTRIVSYYHQMSNWKPVRINHQMRIYLYTVTRVEGSPRGK